MIKVNSKLKAALLSIKVEKKALLARMNGCFEWNAGVLVNGSTDRGG